MRPRSTSSGRPEAQGRNQRRPASRAQRYPPVIRPRTAPTQVRGRWCTGATGSRAPRQPSRERLQRRTDLPRSAHAGSTASAIQPTQEATTAIATMAPLDCQALTPVVGTGSQPPVVQEEHCEQQCQAHATEDQLARRLHQPDVGRAPPALIKPTSVTLSPLTASTTTVSNRPVPSR